MEKVLLKVLFCLCSPIMLTAQSGSLDAMLQRLVDQEINFQHTPGLVVAVLDQDTVSYHAYGQLASSPDPSKVRFDIGAIGKLLISCISAKQIEDLSAPIGQDFGPVLARFQHMSYNRLLSHSAGFPKLPNNIGPTQEADSQPYENYSDSLLMDYLGSCINPNDKPSFFYSHIGHEILIKVLEAKQQVPFKELLHNFVTQDLALHPTSFSTGMSSTQGHSFTGSPVDQWRLGAFQYSLGLSADAAGLMQLVKWYLNQPELWRLETPIIETSKRSNVWASGAWLVFYPKPKNFYPVLTAVGATGGHRVYIALVRETQTACVVLCNSEQEIGNFVMLLMEMLNRGWRKP